MKKHIKYNELACKGGEMWGRKWFMTIVGGMVAAFGILWSGCANADRQTGTLWVYVEDLQGNPVQDVLVCAPQYAVRAHTDMRGKAELQLPVVPDPAYDAILPKTWGEVALVIYKETYTPCVMLDVHVYADRARAGPRIVLHAAQEGQTAPLLLYETPDTAWAGALAERVIGES